MPPFFAITPNSKYVDHRYPIRLRNQTGSDSGAEKTKRVITLAYRHLKKSRADTITRYWYRTYHMILNWAYYITHLISVTTALLKSLAGDMSLVIYGFIEILFFKHILA